MKKYFLTIILVLLTVVFSACGDGAQETEGDSAVQITEGNIDISVYNNDTLNPILTNSQSVIRMGGLIFDGLVKTDENRQIVPQLCESYDVSADGLLYTFYLRQNVKFHDGSQFSAADVQYTMDMIRAYGGNYASVLDNIDSYGGTDPYVFEIILKKPMSLFASFCDFPVLKKGCIGTIIIDEDEPVGEQSDSEKLAYVPIGTGLYVYNAEESDTKTIKLYANTSYYLGEYPGISDITVSVLPDRESENFAFDAGTIDVMYATGSELMSFNPKSSAVIENCSNNSMAFIGLDTTRASLSDASVRKAISLALDRDFIARTILYGYALPSNIPVNPDSWLCNTEVLNTVQSYDEAIGILEKAGYVRDESDIMVKNEDGKTIKLSVELLINGQNPIRVKTAEKIKENLNYIGIEVHINKQNFEDYEDMVENKSYDMYIGEVLIDKSYDLSIFGAADAKYCVYEDAVLDNTILRSQSAVGDDATKKEFYELCRQFSEKYPIIPLYFGCDAVIHTPEIQANFDVSWDNMYDNISDWTIVVAQ